MSTGTARPPFASVNGVIMPFEDARISIMAPGLTFAALVFEGLRGYWNAEDAQLYLFRVKEHLDRLNFSERVVEIDGTPDHATLAEEMLALIQACKAKEDVYVRLQTYVDDWGDMAATGPAGRSIIARARGRAAAFHEGRRFGVSSWRRNAEDASPGRIKASGNYLNSRLVGLEAKRNGYDAAIILNHDGTVSEGPGGCIFLLRDGRFATPPGTAGILESVTRRTILEIASDVGITAEERQIGRTELHLAEEAFYCGTGQEIVPILSFEGKPVGDGAPGPATRRLQDRYDAVVRGRVPEYEHWLTPVY